MTMAVTALALLLAQGQPLPPGHPPVTGGATSASGQTPSGDSALPPGHPPLNAGAQGSGDTTSGGPGALPPGHPAISSGTSVGGGTPAGAPEGLPAGHPSVAPGAAPPTSDELIKRMDGTPDLKTRPKPYEVSAAIGKLYYARARWTDARDFFIQAETTAEPVSARVFPSSAVESSTGPSASSAHAAAGPGCFWAARLRAFSAALSTAMSLETRQPEAEGSGSSPFTSFLCWRNRARTGSAVVSAWMKKSRASVQRARP